MKLLIVTQAVDLDDPILGFFHRWIEEFAKHVEHVEVVCLKEGKHDFPKNVSVHSLGKEKRTASSVVYTIRFLELIWRLRHSYDAVFVHMNPEYVALGGFVWRLLGKRIGLWYTHGKTSFRLRVGVAMAHMVFTASPESMQVSTRKKHVVGHGIDTKLFSAPPHSPHAELRIVTVGRITPVKRLREMLAALDVLARNYTSFSFSIIGAPVTLSDKEYALQLETDIASRSYAEKVRIKGPLTQKNLAAALREYDVFLHLSATNSLDKAVLEAACAGLRIVTTSSLYADALMSFEQVSEASPELIAHAIMQAAHKPPATLAEQNRLEDLIPTLLTAYASSI